jgi:REP-associated tyrosine transposase
VHVWWTTQSDVPSLRSPKIARIVKEAITAGADRFGCRVAIYGIARGRLDLVCEADDSEALSRCLQGLSVRIARSVNAVLERDGKLFEDRYRAELLDDSRSLKDALTRIAAATNGEASKPKIRRLRNGWKRVSA